MYICDVCKILIFLISCFLPAGCFELEYGTIYHNRRHAKPEKKNDPRSFDTKLASKSSII